MSARDEVTGERYRGITHLLERTFWPRYSYRKATKELERSGPRAPVRGARAGIRRGTAVDNELRRVVNDGAEPKHPFTRKILKALELAGLKPVRAQVLVSDPVHGLSTGVDLVCSKGRRTVLVELKCGWGLPGSYEAHSGYMRGALSDVRNSPYYQHQVQTVVTRALYAATYPGEMPDAVVVRVTDAGVHMHRLDPAIAALQHRIVDALGVARTTVAPKSYKTR